MPIKIKILIDKENNNAESFCHLGKDSIESYGLALAFLKQIEHKIIEAILNSKNSVKTNIERDINANTTSK